MKPATFIRIAVASSLLLWGSCGEDSDNLMDGGDDTRLSVARAVEQVNLDTLSHFVRVLSGDTSITLDGLETTIASRHRDYPGNPRAADFLEFKLQSYGLEVYRQNATPTCQNVVGVQRGGVDPGQIYLICAHYDAMPNDSLAPGADDNASGTAAVLEAARILSRYETAYTVIYALWDEEEQGLVGSRFFAGQARDAAEDIRAVLNIDMIGWDSDNSGVVLVDIGGEQVPAEHISQEVLAVDLAQGIAVSPQVVRYGVASDQRAFWEEGYSAVCFIEHVGKDFNDFYHSPQDRIDKFNLPYYHNCVRLIIGSLAALVEFNTLLAVVQ